MTQPVEKWALPFETALRASSGRTERAFQQRKPVRAEALRQERLEA
jgi:hypothetical protein